MAAGAADLGNRQGGSGGLRIGNMERGV